MRKLVTALSLSLIVVCTLVFWFFLHTQPSEEDNGKNSQVSASSADLNSGKSSSLASKIPASGARAAKKKNRAKPVALPHDWVAEPTALLHGWVIDPSGHPVAGARVLVRSSASVFNADPFEGRRILRERALGRMKLDPPGIVAEAETGADGHYSIAIAELSPGVYQVLARQDGFSPQIKYWTWTVESTELNFRLGLADWISGWVLDSAGKPLVGATVEALSEGDEGRGYWSGIRKLVDRTKSGPGSFFQLNVYPGSFKLMAKAEGFAPVSLERVPAGTEGVELLLTPGRSLAGRVVGEAGELISGAEVALYLGEGARNWRRRQISLVQSAFSAPHARQKSDENGEFWFNNLPAGGFSVLVKKNGYIFALEGGELSEEAETIFVEVSLSAGSVLSGKVTNAEQRPVGEALVVVSQGKVPDQRRDEARAAMEDRFLREGRADEIEGLYQFVARRREERRHEPISLYGATAAVETDVEGRFHFENLEKEIYDLSVVVDDLLPSRLENIDLKQGEAEVGIVLKSGIRLKGRVVSSLDGKLLANAHLSLRRRNHRRVVQADSDGSYHFGGLSPGRLGPLTVEAEGYSLEILDGVELAAEPAIQTLDIELDPAALVSGTVVDVAGAPVSGAGVRIQPVLEDEGDEQRGKGERWYRQRLRRALMVSARSDASGRFKLTNVDPGSALQIRVEHPEFKVLRTLPFPVASGEHIEGLELWLNRGGRLAVLVLSPEGTPLPGRPVRLRLQSSPSGVEGGGNGIVMTQTTNAHGEAIFAGMDGGTYLLITGGKGYQPFSAVVFIAEDQASSITVNLLSEIVVTGLGRDRLAGTLILPGRGYINPEGYSPPMLFPHLLMVARL
ncbi:carboxypeptidase-like regulatory domain-containing protein [Acidobacteria bacterium AH-259-G07]|nr:carboxypeptidase-like regulatory domain-containing protein [Acidobacteria bacterium AH-259-G07]